MTLLLSAIPYDHNAQSFSFSTYEQFEKKYKERLPVEEYDISLIKGSEVEEKLFKGTTLLNLEKKLDVAKDLSSWADTELASFCYYMETGGNDYELAYENAQELNINEESKSEAAYRIANEHILDGIENKELKDKLEMYFDYDAYERDLFISGDLYEIEYNGKTFIIDAHSAY